LDDIRAFFKKIISFLYGITSKLTVAVHYLQC
jgi:hypothetical protein